MPEYDPLREDEGEPETAAALLRRLAETAATDAGFAVLLHVFSCCNYLGPLDQNPGQIALHNFGARLMGLLHQADAPSARAMLARLIEEQAPAETRE